MTAPYTYTEKAPEDADGKRFVPVVADTGASNTMLGIQAGTAVIQHGESVAPMMVESTQLLTELGSILSALASLATDAHLATVIASLATIISDLSALSGQLPAALVGGKLSVTDSGLATLATDAHLQTVIADLVALAAQLPAALVGGKLSVTDSGLATLATDAHLTALAAQLPAALVDGKLSVTDSGNKANLYEAIGTNGTYNDSFNKYFLLGLWVAVGGVVDISDATSHAKVINSSPVTAGQYIPIPSIYLGGGLAITFSSGASGTIYFRTV